MIIDKYTNINKVVKHYKSKTFNKKYFYDGTLGAIYKNTETTFKVWSPISTSINLRIYENGTPQYLGGSDVYREYRMVLKRKGVWECVVKGDLEGKYYTYIVSNFIFNNKEIVDPYAKSSGINGLRGMVVDFNKTNPKGWDKVNINKINYDNIVVYETHICDMTNSQTWNGDKTKMRLFTGFFEKNTRYNNVTTGLEHIKELGVNAVQLLPVFDHANEEETDKRSFNWGYNPLNYNVIEGSYSSNPYDGYVRIKEFKELIKTYNEANINIIMDVVYNHVNSHMGSNFDVLMPYYYFRHDKNNWASNGSGCGNETASEMPMFKKFMIDSTLFLAKEYKLYGFRFDLMGIHNVEVMNELVDKLHKEVNKNIIVYGEPWSAGPIGLDNKYIPATQNNITLYKGYGCFNDKIRDSLIKGGLHPNYALGWVTNRKYSNDYNEVLNGIRGIINHLEKDRSKTISYVTCHDNYTLYDRIKVLNLYDDITIKKMAMLANSIVLTSDGIGFMLAGEEMLRTKNGNGNSYNSSYEENEINYELKVKNIDMFNNYKKLIQFKKNVNFSKLKIKRNYSRSVIVYEVSDYIVIHKNGVKADINIDLTGYKLFLDTLNIIEENTILGCVKIECFQTIIAKKC